MPDAAACAECGRAVCRDCFVVLEGRPLCGACKSAFVRQVERGDVVSVLGRRPSPWEKAPSLRSLGLTVAQVLRHPVAFFKGLALEGPGYWSYLIVLGWPSAVLGGILGHFFPFPFGEPDRSRGSVILTSGLAVLAPLQIVLITVLEGAVVHFFLRLLGGAHARLETTIRSLAYANASVSVVDWIPVAGTLGGLGWAIVLQVIALKEMHGTSYVRVILASLVLPGLACFGSFLAAGIAAALLLHAPWR